MQRRELLSRLIILTAAAAVLLAPALGAAQINQQQMNVLFIAVDDLRPQMGCYGQQEMITPNMDKLAAGGALFTRAYCQQAVCSPSRTSLLTGMRPDTTKVYDLKTHFRSTVPDVVTLPQHFKNHGYHSVGIGKIYHGGLEDAPSYSEPHIQANGIRYADAQNQQAYEVVERNYKKERAAAVAAGKRPPAGSKVKGAAFESADVPDNTYNDGWTADHAIEILHRIKDKPFFFAVGFSKPHLPFVAPKKYWDMYDPARIELADNPEPPRGAPSYALTGFGELRNYIGMPKQGPIPDDLARQLIHGYYAATSYVDAQIGRVLDALEAEGLADNTIVVLWGDHGWHLGDHGQWCKHTNFEMATRVPMLLRAPGMKHAGMKSDALTEFVDIYPTLCELAGLPLPAHLEGVSFAPLLEDPTRPWKTAAFSQYPRGELMGYSLRTPRHRYTEWRNRKTGEIDAVEIYDHERDPQENINLAAEEGHAALREELAALMSAGWPGARPKL